MTSISKEELAVRALLKPLLGEQARSFDRKKKERIARVVLKGIRELRHEDGLCVSTQGYENEGMMVSFSEETNTYSFGMKIYVHPPDTEGFELRGLNEESAVSFLIDHFASSLSEDYLNEVEEG